ncbi:Fic family protein [Nostoc sp. PCC 7524]|uniref:Fic family protein n=1 Tax=Nostoc sp. (strain ATCC 29411 / PCC 7524) TaxID=28072 RepID=UPI000A90756E|nr:Fic family protein [Nostoc sp. PCC 7524]
MLYLYQAFRELVLDDFRPFDQIIIAELKKLYDVRFTYNSNAIEGNTLTQSETELVLTKGITIGGKTLDEHLEVIGHKEAIDYIESLAQKNTAINEWEIKQIHNLILRKINPNEAGCYRKLDVMAAGTNYIYPPHYLLSQLMADFVIWLNSDAALTLHLVEYATMAHYRFVSIHPFRDGNGRTARLIMNLSRKAEGRGQEAEGILASVLCRDHSPKGFPQGREQGFKTPTKLKIWWLLFRRGRNPLLNKTFCPLPPASCLLQC